MLCPSAKTAKFGGGWANRSWHPVGYNGATTFDPRGVEGASTKPKLVGVPEPSLAVLFADTPSVPIEKKYQGYVFSPKNGKRNRLDPRRSTPLVSDRPCGGDEQQTARPTQAGVGAARGQRRRDGPEQPRLGRRPCGSPDRLVDPATGRRRKPSLGFREGVSEPGQSWPRAGWVN